MSDCTQERDPYHCLKANQQLKMRHEETSVWQVQRGQRGQDFLWQYEDIQVLFFLTFKKSHETDIQLTGQKKRILVVHAQFYRIYMNLRIKLMKFRIDI